MAQDLVSEVSDIVAQWGQEQVDKIRENIAKKGNNANGDTFAASFVPMDVEIGEDYCVWKLTGPLWYDVIDKGGKRWSNKMPPVDEIMQWMAHRGIQAQIKTHKQKHSVSGSIKAHAGKWQNNPKYKAQRSMAFAIAINIKKKGVLKRFGHKGSNFYSEVMNEKAFIDLRQRLIAKTANPNFIFQFIDPNKE